MIRFLIVISFNNPPTPIAVMSSEPTSRPATKIERKPDPKWGKVLASLS